MKEIDLYDIILDGFINVLNEHGIKEVSIPTDFTLSVVKKCIEKLQNTSDYAKCKKLLEETYEDLKTENIQIISKLYKKI